MTTFCQQRSDSGQRACQMRDASALQIHAMNCTAKLHGHFHETQKIVRNNFPDAAQERVNELVIYAEEALPLVETRILRLAQISPMMARSPARRLRDDREPSGKTTGNISCAANAQLPGSIQAVTTAMPADGRRDNRRIIVVTPGNVWPETGKTTRRLPAVMLLNVRQDSGQPTCRKSRRQLSIHDIQKYEHTNHTNARS